MKYRLPRVFKRYGITIPLLGRMSLGAVYFYFGFLKLFPGLSPGEALVGETFGRLTFDLMPPALSVPLLGVWEVVMGIVFFAGRTSNFWLGVFLIHMMGTLLPYVFFPELSFSKPGVMTLLGQYLMKNFVLIACGLGVFLDDKLNPRK